VIWGGFPLVRLERSEFRLVEHLFQNHRRKRIDIDATLEGITGSVSVDNPVSPKVACIQSGGYSMYGGDPTLPAACTLLKSCSRSIVVEDAPWEQALVTVHGDALGNFVRHEFCADNLDRVHLCALKAKLPSGCQIHALDAKLAHQVVAEIGSLCLGAFQTPVKQVACGPGYCVIQGSRALSAATPAVVCRTGIDIQITTHPDFRRRGLATAVSAALILECLERKIEPHWSAANDWSADLARKLGYVEDFAFVQYFLPR